MIVAIASYANQNSFIQGGLALVLDFALVCKAVWSLIMAPPVQAFNIIQDRISRARLAGDPPDLSLHPRLSDIGLSEFHRASEAIDRGYQETSAKLGEIMRMQAALQMA